MEYIGIFKWYDNSKGFGVISTMIPKNKGRAEVFFHHTCWLSGMSFSTDKPIVFEIRKRKKGGYEAYNCRPFSPTLELWQQLFQNKEYNLTVDSENGSKNLMQECISLINTSHQAVSFIESYNLWHREHPITGYSDLTDYLRGGKNVKVPEFQSFIKSVISSFPFENRKELFKNNQVGLFAFTDEECMQIIELINKNHYDIIRESNPNLYLRILREKILITANSFCFNFEMEHTYFRYSKTKTEYDVLSDLFSDFILCANDNEINELQEEIGAIILNKKDDFLNIVNNMISNSKDANSFATKYRKLTSFPNCLKENVVTLFKENAKILITEKYDFTSTVGLMSMGLLPIDLSYIDGNFLCINNENIHLIVKEDSLFSSEFVSSTLFRYLSKTNDVDTTLYWYNKRTDIQTYELTQTIKDYIKANYEKPKVTFVSKAIDYILLLGEDFVFQITQEYLLKTHSTEGILQQLSHAKDNYKETLLDYLFSFHKVHREFIDDRFVEPLCKRKEFHLLLTEDYMVEIIEAYIDNLNDYNQSMIYAKMYSKEVKKRIEDYLIATLSEEKYMHLWEKECCDKLPEEYLDFYFDDNEYKYSLADKWLQKGRITKQIILSAMLRTYIRIRDITYYRYFRTEFLIYVFFKNKQWNNEIESSIKPSKIQLFKWALNPEFSDYKSICDTFVLFPESIQVKLLKFIFLSIEQGKMTLVTNDLLQLYNCLSEYMNYSEQDRPTMSLSASIIIESLNSYDKDNKFITDKDFYKLVYKSVANGSSIITPIGSFFDKCAGKKKRFFPYQDSISRFIFPIIDKNGDRWFIINFEYDTQLVDTVKHITGRKYHPQYKIWFAPESSLDEIKKIAEENKFLFLKKDMSLNAIGQPLSFILKSYTQAEYREAAWNLSELKDWNEDMPRITWCEGRESQKKEEQDVWWCVGHNPCNACAIRLHSIEEWQDYTLFDFCKILGFNIAETNKYGHFNTGVYTLFVTSINRFNKLLERLYCRECGKIIYPIDSNYSVVGATNFHCTNPQCSQYHKKIYLNHCYTRKCRGIIDSRDEAKCPNGLVICATCGTCCTTQMFEQRLTKLQTTGSRFIPQELIYKVQNDEGHINHKDKTKKDRFFCHNCGQELTGDPANTICSKCGTVIQYNISLISRQ